MSTQRAIAAKPNSSDPFAVDVPRPAAPNGREVLCKTLELGICGTDREILASQQPWVPDGEECLVLGHECLAQVEAIGESVQRLSVGQLVVPTVRRPLRDSPVRIDMLAFGNYTERGIVKQHGFSQLFWLEEEDYLFSVEEELAALAVFTEPQAVAEKAANEASLLQRARFGDTYWRDDPPRVLVTGQGPIAFAALLACTAREWPVTMMGRDQSTTFRSQLAATLGLKQYVRLADADLSPADPMRDGYDLLLECTGNDGVLVAASNALAPRGAAVWLGATREGVARSHNIDRLMRQAVVHNHLHVGSVNAAPRDFRDAMAHLSLLHKRCPHESQKLFTARVSLDEAVSHFRERQSQGIKSVVMYE